MTLLATLRGKAVSHCCQFCQIDCRQRSAITGRDRQNRIGRCHHRLIGHRRPGHPWFFIGGEAGGGRSSSSSSGAGGGIDTEWRV